MWCHTYLKNLSRATYDSIWPSSLHFIAGRLCHDKYLLLHYFSIPPTCKLNNKSFWRCSLLGLTSIYLNLMKYPSYVKLYAKIITFRITNDTRISNSNEIIKRRILQLMFLIITLRLRVCNSLLTIYSA